MRWGTLSMIARRMGFGLSWAAGVIAAMVLSVGVAGAESTDKEYDFKRSDEIKAILKAMPEYGAVEIVLTDAASRLAKLGASNNLYYTSDDFLSLRAEILYDLEFREQRKLKNDEILFGLNLGAKAFIPEVGCFVAFAEDHSLAAQWQALAPALSIDDYGVWWPVRMAVTERCKKALEESSGKPNDDSATALFEFGRVIGQATLSSQSFALIDTATKKGFFDTNKKIELVKEDIVHSIHMLQNHDIISWHLIDKPIIEIDRLLIGKARKSIQGVTKLIRLANYAFADVYCKKDKRYCDLALVFKSESDTDFCKYLSIFLNKNKFDITPLETELTGDSKIYGKEFEYVLIKYSSLCYSAKYKADIPLEFFLNRANDTKYVSRAYLGKIFNSANVYNKSFEEFSERRNIEEEFSINRVKDLKKIYQDYLALQALPSAYRTSLEASRPFLGDEFVNKALAEIPVDRSPATRESEEALSLGKADIRDVQTRLNATGAQIAVNGIMDKPARAALRQWQGALGYEPTGFLNQTQLNELRERTKDRVALTPPSAEIKDAPTPESQNSKARAATQKPTGRQAQEASRRDVGDSPVKQRPNDDGSQVVGRILVPLLGEALRHCAFRRCF